MSSTWTSGTPSPSGRQTTSAAAPRATASGAKSCPSRVKPGTQKNKVPGSTLRLSKASPAISTSSGPSPSSSRSVIGPQSMGGCGGLRCARGPSPRRVPTLSASGSPGAVTAASGGQRAADDRRTVDPRGERAERAPARLAQAAGAEGVGHGRRRVADEQRGLEGQREILDGTPREPLGVGTRERLKGGGQRVEVGVQARIAAAGELALGEEGRQTLGLAAHRAQDVEA